MPEDQINQHSIQFVKGVGPARAKLFAQLGISTVEDLLHFFPYRYDDRRQFTSISKLSVGKFQTVSGIVLAGGARRSFNTGRAVVEVALGDDTGRIFAVWFNQPYLANIFKPGTQVVCYGKVDIFKNRLQIVAPDFELIDKDDNSLSMGRIVPIYPSIKGLGQKYIRKIIHECLKQHAESLTDVIPESIRQRHQLKHLRESIYQLHYPNSLEEQEQGNNRIAFEEFFLFQISVLLRRMSIVYKKGIKHAINTSLIKSYWESIPFALTGAQQQVIKEISNDMQLDRPMLRLVQGDVGSGKTIVAFFACIAAIINKHQAAIMAPTEILAQQHFENFRRLFSKGVFSDINVVLLTSSLTKKEKETIYSDLKDGKIDLIVGTHALLEEVVVFNDLSLVVIDEQHKFGVSQRALLSTKTKVGEGSPDVLIMTATPIPRTLCLTLYGDLDVSIINEMPPGRGAIKTYHFPSDKAQGVYQKVREWVNKGTQAYIIYPLVEESDKLELKAAKDMYEHLRRFEFQGLRIALVHGQMDKKEADQYMQAFKRHELDVLVATTILEVGIDVPNANVMVIEHAERFGLSQLHQLRGRIGRGKQNAVCLLLGNPTTEEGTKRLEAIVKTTDGFKIAEYDLEIRGPGHYFGRQQHGANELRVANPIKQMAILEKARQEAIDLVESDKTLTKSINKQIKLTIKKRYPTYLDFIPAG